MNFELKEIEIDKKQFIAVQPIEELTDTEYDIIKPLIETMGGHWRERVNGFIFDKDKFKRTEKALKQEEMQFFPTPIAVADRVIKLSGLNDFDTSTLDNNTYPFVLEPSAGQGVLLNRIYCHIRRIMREYVVEPDYENARCLEKDGHSVEEMTFEEFYKIHRNDKKEITHVIMNPPFSDSRDVKHVMMAYDLMKDGGVLVAVISENALYYENEHSKKFREWLKNKDVYTEPVPYGSFSESGTTVDTVIIKIEKGSK